MKEALLTVGLTVDEAKNQEDDAQLDSEAEKESPAKAAQAEGKAVALIKDEVCMRI